MEAKELIEALIERGWTQQQIGVRIGMGQAAISKLVRGDVNDMLSRAYRRLEALHAEVIAEAKVA
jgi:transcriptional regulator with XRE-family HTH domain